MTPIRSKFELLNLRRRRGSLRRCLRRRHRHVNIDLDLLPAEHARLVRKKPQHDHDHENHEHGNHADAAAASAAVILTHFIPPLKNAIPVRLPEVQTDSYHTACETVKRDYKTKSR